jgi:hypothetical protein
MPAQAVLHARALGYQVIAVVDQQAQLAGGPVKVGNREVWLP